MIVLPCRQGDPEWCDARRGIPTASEFDRIITPNGKASSQQSSYIGELIDQLVNQNAANHFMGNEHTERGKALEPKAREWYRFMTGADLREVGFVLRDDRLTGCSPDSIVSDIGGMEIKAPEGKKHVQWMLEGELPAEHKQQVHGSLAITKFAWWDFISYCPGYKPFSIRVYPSAYTKLVATELDAFLSKLQKAKAQFVEYIQVRSAA